MADTLTHWVMLGPGPSMSQALADTFREHPNVCVVGNAFELAPWARLLVASDRSWWRRHPKAQQFEGLRYDSQSFQTRHGTGINSGALALFVLASLGATHVELYGFDMHGTHFFGPYTNGCANTNEVQRQVHLQQFRDFARSHPEVTVINHTAGSRIDAFQFAIQHVSTPDSAPHLVRAGAK